ncbi:armadillo-type protein [Lipomyces oligophaga]|uniref:armadillo-type protein n=1 Tax=Lipomyces oligophaga TaxID=45792 RepID=UPI0034CE227D
MSSETVTETPAPVPTPVAPEVEVPSPTSVIFSNSYLDERLSEVCSQTIDWSSLGLAAEHVEAIKAIDKVPLCEAVATVGKLIILKNPSLYAFVICTIVNTVTDASALKYTLALASSIMLECQPFTCALFVLPPLCEPLLALLDSEDAVLALLAAKVLILLIIATDSPPVAAVQKVLECSHNKLSLAEDYNLKDLGAQAFAAILSVKCTRALFWEKIMTYGPPLVETLKSGHGGLQLQYNTIMVFWLLSFELSPAQHLNKTCDIIAIVMDIIKTAIKEKIIRVSVSLFFNLATIAPQENITSFLVLDGLPVISGMAQRKWTDGELEADLTCLANTLQEAQDSMSTFDEYLTELTTGRLKWSPAHKSVDFWKRNSELFKEDDWKLLKELGKLIATSEDNLVLAVASNDISFIITELPEGLKVLTDMGVKTKIMEMMTHPDADVKYQALKATQVFVARAFV